MNLFVAGLNYRTTEEKIEQAFGQFGEVKSVKIIFDKFENRSKGFGFVEMGSEEEGNSAIQGLNGVELDGRTLVVKVSEPRERR